MRTDSSISGVGGVEPAKNCSTRERRKALLWITWADPAPELDGQRLYSGRLIAACADAGADIDVLCLAGEIDRSNAEPAALGVTSPRCVNWHTVQATPRASWRSPFSFLPNVAFRAVPRSVRKRLAELLRESRWDAVVLDGLSSGWAVAMLERIPEWRRPDVVHLSHNHEASVRRDIARAFRGNPAVKAALLWDAIKTRRLERRMVAFSDVTSAITPEDLSRYRPDAPSGARLLVLTPGYQGSFGDSAFPDLATRSRRAIVVGSFHWIAKQMNLRDFLEVAAPVFKAAGCDLQVVGAGPAPFLAEMRERFPDVSITGAVDDVRPYLRAARVSLVPEQTGGGFKLKALDYVFNRTPILAIHGAVAGTPLRDPVSIRYFDGFKDLARGAVSAIDDVEALRRMDAVAYATCRDRFDWHDRGGKLLDALDRL